MLVGVLGCCWLCGFCAQKSISPRHIVCLLVERLISLGASLGVLFLTVLLGACSAVRCACSPMVWVHERVHSGLRPVALLVCLTVCAVTEPGVVRGWLGYAEGANVHRINRIGLENGLTKFTSFTR